ncbi:MAG: phosphodiester glycosidase family protein [Halanaerobiaceae bacterium]
MIFKRFRNSILIALIILFVYSSASFATFFSGFMEDFIRDGKELNYLIDKESSNIYLEPINDLLIERKEDGSYVNLEARQKYLLKIGDSNTNIYRLQLFASEEEKRIKQIWKSLEENGYSDLAVIQEDGLFKLRIGSFSQKEDAEPLLNELKKDGWNPWIVEDRQFVEDGINIFDSDRKAIFSGSEFNLDGDMILNNNRYQGKTLFTLKNGNIIIENRTKLNNLMAAIMESKFGEQEVSLDVLKAYAISLRTYILSYLYKNDDTLKLEEEGICNKENIIYAIKSTDGMIIENLQQEGPFPYRNMFLNTDDYILESDYDYQQILANLYDNISYRDLREESYLRKLVDAKISWGLRYKEFQEYIWDGPRIITVVEVDMNRRFIYLKPVLAQGKVKGLDDLSRIIPMEENSLVAVNGGFFHYSGRPLGLIYQNGELISETIKNRTALLISEDNEVYFHRVSWNGIIAFNDKEISLNGLNRIVEENEVILYNHFYDKTAPAIKSGILELVVVDNIVQEINYTKDERRPAAKKILENANIIQIHGKAREKFQDLKVGDNLIIENSFSPDFEELNIKTAIAAGPLLIQNGDISVASKEEQFQADIAIGRAPRSAVGKTKDNKLVFFTVDGRQMEYSIGISLDELAKFMQEYGIISGMNLDGGSSARMIVRGFTMNRPSADRLLSNGIVIGIK